MKAWLRRAKKGSISIPWSLCHLTGASINPPSSPAIRPISPLLCPPLQIRSCPCSVSILLPHNQLPVPILVAPESPNLGALTWSPGLQSPETSKPKSSSLLSETMSTPAHTYAAFPIVKLKGTVHNEYT